jgi:hypothetical protein
LPAIGAASAAGNLSAQKIWAPLRTERDLRDSQSEVTAAGAARAEAAKAKTGREKRIFALKQCWIRLVNERIDVGMKLIESR